MTAFFLGFAIIGIGTAVMWAGTILRLSANAAKADDAKVLLGVGLGMILTGCGVAACLSSPDQHLEATRQMMTMQLTQGVTKTHD
jgi:hypothetical protein